MFTRRDFIKTMSLLSGAVLAPVRWLGRWAGVQPILAEEPPVEGELYAGFVLLPEGAEVPEFVQFPEKGAPNMFPKPLPLYFTNPVEPNDLAAILEKVDFLPTPGIKVSTQSGFLYYWIENDIFYTLSVDPSSLLKEPQELVNFLTVKK